MVTDDIAGQSSIGAHTTTVDKVWASSPVPAHAPRAPRHPPPSLSACSLCFLPPLLLSCVRSDAGLNGHTLPTSSSCSFASYKSNQHVKLLADTSSSLHRAQIESVGGQRAAALNCVRHSGTSGVPHAERVGMHVADCV